MCIWSAFFINLLYHFGLPVCRCQQRERDHDHLGHYTYHGGLAEYTSLFCAYDIYQKCRSFHSVSTVSLKI